MEELEFTTYCKSLIKQIEDVTKIADNILIRIKEEFPDAEYIKLCENKLLKSRIKIIKQIKIKQQSATPNQWIWVRIFCCIDIIDNKICGLCNVIIDNYWYSDFQSRDAEIIFLESHLDTKFLLPDREFDGVSGKIMKICKSVYKAWKNNWEV